MINNFSTVARQDSHSRAVESPSTESIIKPWAVGRPTTLLFPCRTPRRAGPNRTGKPDRANPITPDSIQRLYFVRDQLGLKVESSLSPISYQKYFEFRRPTHKLVVGVSQDKITSCHSEHFCRNSGQPHEECGAS